jgi:TonB family protein
MTSGVDSGPNLLLDWHESAQTRRYFRAGAGSIAVHVVLFTLGFTIASLDVTPPRNATEIYMDLSKATPLVAPPPRDLTQKAPNRGKIAKEVNVEDLQPRPPTEQRLPPAPAVRTFKPPVPQTPGPPQPPAPRLAEPPKIEASVTAPPELPAMAGTPKAPPPQIQPVEQPKLAFETPGQNGSSADKGLAKLTPPKATVEEAIRSVIHGGGGQGGIVVGDIEQPPDLPESIRLPPSPGRSGSSLELMSDPMGVDFKPYLIRILALVRRNWFAVIPESARLGNRGLVQLQFIIDRQGQVPKLVIATPSGSEALDRAAVAGISASVPFPPLPAEFKGQQIRLQFAFKYNVK